MPKRISSDAFLRILTAHDFRFVSQRGSHAKYRLGLFPPTDPETKTPSTDPTTPPAP